jgi:hypothetical protein
MAFTMNNIKLTEKLDILMAAGEKFGKISGKIKNICRPRFQGA